jgi:chromosome segregation ATPase
MRDQYSQQTQGRMAELERENLNARAQYERDQLMLEQYDRRMKALEGELQQLQVNFGQQNASKDEQIRALQEQINTWRTKYEALAKLYSQLRHEHLELLQKFKGVQLKAASAQEAIDRREKLERELKTKNLELADMIRERDRALHDKDRSTGGHKDDLEKLRRELRFALDKAENAERSKGSELSSLLSRHNREIADLEEALRNKTRALDDAQNKYGDQDSDLERLLREKEDELEIFKAGMDQTLLELNELRFLTVFARSPTSLIPCFKAVSSVSMTLFTSWTLPCKQETKVLPVHTFCRLSRRLHRVQWNSRPPSTTSLPMDPTALMLKSSALFTLSPTLLQMFSQMPRV